MPIRPENKHFYQCPEWEEVRELILKRAQNKCEFCGKPNGKLVYVTRDGTGRWNEELAKRYSNVKVLVKRILNEIPRGTGKQSDLFVKLWTWFGADGKSLEPAFPPGENDRSRAPESDYIYCIKVVLTIMHLNHIPSDRRPENLKAGCQRCHLWFDRDWHKQNRARRKDRNRPILVEIERQLQDQSRCRNSN